MPYLGIELTTSGLQTGVSQHAHLSKNSRLQHELSKNDIYLKAIVCNQTYLASFVTNLENIRMHKKGLIHT